MNYIGNMNVHPSAPTDPDAFLRWNEGREGKRELVRGKIIEMMTGATRGHAILVSELSAALRQQIDRDRVFSTPPSMRVGPCPRGAIGC